MRMFSVLLLVTLLGAGCTTTSKLQLAGERGIVLLSEVDKSGLISDQRVMVPGEVESTRVKEWQVRRPDRNGILQVKIVEGRKSVLERDVPPGVTGFKATRNEAWEFELLRSPRANPPPQSFLGR